MNLNETDIVESQRYLNVLPLDILVTRLSERQNRLKKFVALNAPKCIVNREKMLVECASAALSRRTIGN